MKLNCGCGPIWLPDYVNVDISDLEELAENARRAGLAEAPPAGVIFEQRDLGQPWPWATGSVEATLASNLLEHLDSRALTQFLSEAFRVLVPGGEMTGGVPDFERIWNYYVTGADWSWVPDWQTGGPYKSKAANVLQNMAHGWGHQQIFTRAMLWERIAAFGFETNVYPCGEHGLRFVAKKP